MTARSAALRDFPLFWFQPKPGYKPVCCGNDCADLFYITASILGLYVAYGVFFLAMYTYWLYTGNGALYTFLCLMGVYWLAVGLLVYFGAVSIEKEAVLAEAEALRQQEEDKNKRA